MIRVAQPRRVEVEGSEREKRRERGVQVSGAARLGGGDDGTRPARPALSLSLSLSFFLFSSYLR